MNSNVKRLPVIANKSAINVWPIGITLCSSPVSLSICTAGDIRQAMNNVIINKTKKLVIADAIVIKTGKMYCLNFNLFRV